MTPLFEVGYKCGCQFANYNHSVVVKLCEEHYEKFKNVPVQALLMERLKQPVTFKEKKGKKNG